MCLHTSSGILLSEDPAGVGGGLNLYLYAGANPVGGRDPYGLADDAGPGDPMTCKDERGRPKVCEMPGVEVTAATGGGGGDYWSDVGLGILEAPFPGQNGVPRGFTYRPSPYPDKGGEKDPDLRPEPGLERRTSANSLDCPGAIANLVVTLATDAAFWGVGRVAMAGVRAAIAEGGRAIGQVAIGVANADLQANLRVLEGLRADQMMVGGINGIISSLGTGSNPVLGAVLGAIPGIAEGYALQQANGACGWHLFGS